MKWIEGEIKREWEGEREGGKGGRKKLLQGCQKGGGKLLLIKLLGISSSSSLAPSSLSFSFHDQGEVLFSEQFTCSVSTNRFLLPQQNGSRCSAGKKTFGTWFGSLLLFSSLSFLCLSFSSSPLFRTLYLFFLPPLTPSDTVAVDRYSKFLFPLSPPLFNHADGNTRHKLYPRFLVITYPISLLQPTFSHSVERERKKRGREFW